MRRAAAIAGLMIAGCAVAPLARAEDWRGAIVHVGNEAAGITCSGVLIQANLVATAGHCLHGARAAQLLFKPAGMGRAWRGVEILAAGGFTAGAEVTVIEVGRDWALVRTDPMPVTPIPVAPLAQFEIQHAIAEGARLASFGFADGDALVDLQGCALRPVFGDAFFTTGCAVKPGDSGGPVLLVTEAGARVIGINSAIREDQALVVSARRFATWVDAPAETRALSGQGSEIRGQEDAMDERILRTRVVALAVVLAIEVAVVVLATSALFGLPGVVGGLLALPCALPTLRGLWRAWRAWRRAAAAAIDDDFPLFI